MSLSGEGLWPKVVNDPEGLGGLGIGGRGVLCPEVLVGFEDEVDNAKSYSRMHDICAKVAGSDALRLAGIVVSPVEFEK